MKNTLVLIFLSMLCAIHAEAGTAAAVFQIAAKSTVAVLAFDARGNMSIGTGVILPESLVATNCHVIQDAARVVVRHQRREYRTVTGLADTRRDVCAITVMDLEAPPVSFGNSGRLAVGTRVYAIGTPHGLELTLSEGIVSGFREDETGRYIQTTTPVSPGSSGGGLFDEAGRLVGLTTFTVEKGQNLNFALPVEWIEELLTRHADQPPAALRVDISETEDGQRIIRITD